MPKSDNSKSSIKTRRVPLSEDVFLHQNTASAMGQCQFWEADSYQSGHEIPKTRNPRSLASFLRQTNLFHFRALIFKDPSYRFRAKMSRNSMYDIITPTMSAADPLN
jgi:hypothetical protein